MTRSRESLLRSWALEAGFDRAGIARTDPSAHESALRDWVARGDQAGMTWFEKGVDKRLDSRRVLADARSVLCVALDYHPLREGRQVTGDLWPRVARYARGRDYHDVMQERLKLLEARIVAAFPGCGTRRYVDTGPVLERELAARAGLGSFGKNTNLLHPEAGSWFLLGELFLSLELEPDSGFSDLCGSCTLCLEACPTGALPEAYRLDSRRCISYWTIEHRGPVPEEIREGLGDWVFGCDVCQEVCPVNAAPTEALQPEMDLPRARAKVDLAGLLGIEAESYVEIFRGSPMKRAKREGLQRNAATAMGNRRDPAYHEALEEALELGSETVRIHAAWALGRVGGEGAKEVLLRRREEESSETVRLEIAGALDGLEAPAKRPSGDASRGAGRTSRSGVRRG